ncbi:hypothetical protein Acr_21g0000590 [Actinidia rufa]|uniref:DUF4378 domain-containing protein n=1 Tax=Actinidia rufa TaxID=165716 RepID=A0A7J0GF75_9ERIC|nr:hypothetical protein Acr_21g0000590 [Actinidia rufa]
MGGLSDLFDFNQGSMARKVLTQKRHGGGSDAPRNSLELPVETSQSYCAVGDDIPYSYEVRHEWPENSYPTAASMKKLINEEISKGPKTRRNAPSIVARLMGMDMLPLDTKIGAQQAEKKNEKPGTNFPHKEQNKKGSGGRVHCNSNSSRQIESDSFQHNKDRDLNHQRVGMKSKKPRHREHPQEEELQKFKKEFEAWQAARFRECSKVVELGRIPSQWLAQETLNVEKVALYSNTSRISGTKNSMELEGNVVKTRSREAGELQNHEQRKELYPSEQKETYPLRSRTLSRDFEQSLLMNYGQKLDISSAPIRIVILRPGPERVSDNDDSWISSSGTSEERGSMEDFLEEVKQRLKNELQGKIKKGTMVRGGGVETPCSEKPSDPKEIAQRIAKQVRESVTRDFGVNLVRSESTRSYRSEIQYNGPGSPEFINRDTRRFLAARLKNVLKAETNLHIPTVATGSSNSSVLYNEKGRLEESISNLKVVGNTNCCDIVEDEPEMQTRSFRRGPDDDIMNHRDLSPRNLIRSLSAPVSGTSFGKLLLEDRHILTGAHIRRKHEAIENVTMEGGCLAEKIQSVEQPDKYEFDSMKDIASGPTVVMNFGERHVGERHENCTEVPPSPASVCSSVYEESWRAADHLSSASTPDLSPLEDTTVPRVFREISSNLNELRKQLNKLGAGGPKEVVIEEHPLEAETELEDETEAYIRDLLVASGLYEGSSDKVLSRWDPFAKPISNQIFEQVEESYMKMNKDNEGSRRDQGEKKVDHKLLLDLLNEALAIVLGPPMTMSRFRKKAIGPTPRPPHGRKLLDHVWEIVGEHLHPPNKIGYTLDRMVARDLGYTPWSGLMSDDIDALAKDMESKIIGVLIDEILIDLKL